MVVCMYVLAVACVGGCGWCTIARRSAREGKRPEAIGSSRRSSSKDGGSASGSVLVAMGRWRSGWDVARRRVGRVERGVSEECG